MNSSTKSCCLSSFLKWAGEIPPELWGLTSTNSSLWVESSYQQVAQLTHNSQLPPSGDSPAFLWANSKLHQRHWVLLISLAEPPVCFISLFLSSFWGSNEIVGYKGQEETKTKHIYSDFNVHLLASFLYTHYIIPEYTLLYVYITLAHWGKDFVYTHCLFKCTTFVSVLLFCNLRWHVCTVCTIRNLLGHRKHLCILIVQISSLLEALEGSTDVCSWLGSWNPSCSTCRLYFTTLSGHLSFHMKARWEVKKK